ncbi:putative LPS assembly protein LptD [Pedobacter sp. UC225_65]|uniref:putative LPS assembly protein LptD n=1 Tax=Pedobacter sp. UC225_65 TaxID=3350173 RepID=UPI0036704ADA
MKNGIFRRLKNDSIKTTSGDVTLTDTVSGFKRAGEYNVGMNMSTKIYGTKQFKNLGRIMAIRHVVTPTLNFNYKPDFSKSNYGYYKPLQYYTNDIRPGKSVPTGEYPKVDYLGRQPKYSIFEGAAFGGPSMGQQANLSFSVDNNVELKLKSKKDTTNGGEKKIPIIQGLTIGGSYNFAEPTAKKLSLLNFSGRSQFTDKLGFNFGGTLNPYGVEEYEVKTGTGVNEVTTINYRESDRYVWRDGKLPRLVNFNFSFDYSLNPEALKKKNQNMEELRNQNSAARTPEQIEELAAISRDPNAFVDFNIPWNFAFSYSFSYSNPLSRRETRTVSNTLNFNGDFSLTPKWKIQFNSGYDFKAKDLSYTSFAIYRDLHCWDLSASWIPLGAYQSYSVTIKVKAAILQDLKLSKRKGYYTRY